MAEKGWQGRDKGGEGLSSSLRPIPGSTTGSAIPAVIGQMNIFHMIKVS